MAFVCRCVWATLLALWAFPAFAAEKSVLPLKRVRLYESGVGYFERSGAFRGQGMTLPVPASHLDDALKTLVVFSPDGPSRVAGVEFGSSVSKGVARARAGLGVEDVELGFLKMLSGLKGMEVELRIGAESFRGRMVEVLGADRSDFKTCVSRGGEKTVACTPEGQPVVIVMGKNGELRRIPVDDLSSVRPTDPAVTARFSTALDSLSEESARLLKDMRVMAEGTGRVSLGYVSETPVWRASYRLVLSDTPSTDALLQGWALVHNDSDETWNDVDLELVNGRPDSFLFPLAAPRYARRELVTPNESLSTVPQLLENTPDALWGDEVGEVYGEGGLGLSGIGEGGGGRGEGIGLGHVGTHGYGSGAPGRNGPSSVVSVGNLAAVSGAAGTESGALFRFALKEPLDLRPHGSALVPFLAEGVAGRRIALFEHPGSEARMATHLVYRGSQTVPAGTLAVFSDGGFAGETLMPRLKPGESTTLEYGVDLDAKIERRSVNTTYRTERLTVSGDQLVEHYVLYTTVAYDVENRSQGERDFFLRLDFVNHAKIEGADELVYDAQKSRAYAVFRAQPRAQKARTLKAQEGLEKEHPLAGLRSAVLRRLSAEKHVPQRERDVVRAALETLARAEAEEGALTRDRAALATAEAEVARFREHARAVRAEDGAEEIAARLIGADERAEKLRSAVRVRTARARDLRRRTRATLEWL